MSYKMFDFKYSIKSTKLKVYFILLKAIKVTYF